MPKTTAPLLSFDARGQIAKTQVYSSWRGVPYVRRYTIPNNPRTDGQVTVRGIFSMLNSAWKFAPATVTAPWNAFATGRPFLGRNAFIGQNSKLFSGPPPEEDMEGFIFSPGARGGIPATGLILTPDSEAIDVAVTLPVGPAGWTITAGIAAAIPNLDPADPFGGVWNVVRETGTPDDITIPDLEASTEYVVGYWLEWTRSDSLTAYSTSLSGLATPTA